MEAKRYASTLWRWKWLILLATLVGTLTSYWVESGAPRVYRTTTTLMVGRYLESADPKGTDFQLSQQLAQVYVLMVRREALLRAVIDTLGLDTSPSSLASQVSGIAPPNSPLVQVTVVDVDPQRARMIADEVARQLILQSPTPQERDQDEDRQFVREQLSSLRARITDAETELKDLDQRLARETSARAIQDTQNQMTALRQKITTWQTTYTSLLDYDRGSQVNYLSAIEPAPPAAPVGSPLPVNTLLAAATGFLLAAGAALALEFLDDRVKSPDAVSQLLRLPVLGTIARTRKIREPRDHLVVLQKPQSSIGEAYRRLRTSLQFRPPVRLPTRLLVTSPGPAEGKTTIACNLAITLAQAGQHVILCDANLREPSIHTLFGLPNQLGLADILREPGLPLEAVLLDTQIPGLQVVSSGPPPASPGDLLGSKHLAERLRQLDELADVIVLDSPGALAVADASVLGASAGGVILVVAAGRTRGESARRARAALEEVGSTVLGVVLTGHVGCPTPGFAHYQVDATAATYANGKNGPAGAGAEKVVTVERT